MAYGEPVSLDVGPLDSGEGAPVAGSCMPPSQVRDNDAWALPGTMYRVIGFVKNYSLGCDLAATSGRCERSRRRHSHNTDMAIRKS